MQWKSALTPKKVYISVYNICNSNIPSGHSNRFQYPLQFTYHIRKPHPLLANILGAMPVAERTWITHTNYITIVHREMQKSFFQGTVTLPDIKQKVGKAPNKKCKATAKRSPCTTNEKESYHGAWSPAGFPEGNPPRSTSEICPLTRPGQTLLPAPSPATPLWQTQSSMLQPLFLCLVSLFSYLSCSTAWNQPVGFSCQRALRARLCWPSVADPSTVFPESILGGQEADVSSHDPPATLSI